MRTKLKKFSALIMLLCFGSVMAWAEDVVTATQTISPDGKTCTWTDFNVTVTSPNSLAGDGLIFEATGNKISTSSGATCLKANTFMYFMVPSSNVEGTISMTCSSEASDRTLSLISSGTIAMKKTTDLKAFNSNDIVNVGGNYYVKMKSDNGDFKFKSLVVALTSGSYNSRVCDEEKDWNANLLDKVEVPKDGVLKISFKNHPKSGNTDNYKNWDLLLTKADDTHLDLLRSDVFGQGWRGGEEKTYTNTSEFWQQDGYDWQNFCTKMDDADVEITISRNGRVLQMTAVATSADKTSIFTETFTIEDEVYSSENTIYARLTAAFATLSHVSYTTGAFVTTDVVGNGTAEASHSFISGSTDVTFSATPADGFLFSHWSIGEENISTENPYVVTVPGTTNYNLTANFVAPLHITYDANGATGAVPVDNTDYKSGDVATIMGQGDMTNGTKTFFGWATATDQTNGRASLLPNSSFTITANQTVYAMWGDFTPVTTNQTWNLSNAGVSLGVNSTAIKNNVWYTSSSNRNISSNVNGVYIGGGGSISKLNAHFRLGAGAYNVIVNYTGTEGQTISLMNATTGVSESAAGTVGRIEKIFNNPTDVNDLYIYSNSSGFTISSIEIAPVTSRTLNFRVNDGEGAVSATLDGKAISSGTSVSVGSVVTLTASAAEWYQPNGWYNGVNNLSQEASFDYTIPEGSEDITLDANFIRYYRVQAVSNNDSWGTARVYSDEAHTQEITPETNVQRGNKVYVVATPTSGYNLKNWSSNPGSWTITDLIGEKKVDEIAGADVKEIITLTATFESEQQNSDLTLLSDTKTMKVDDTWTLTKDVDYTTSSDGAVTVTVVDNTGKAVTYFANAAGAKVTATAQGTAYVKISQAATANYGAAEATITVNITRDEQTVTEMTTWNLTGTDVTSHNDGEYNKLYWNAQSGTVSDNAGTYVGLKGLKLNGSQDIYFNTDGKAGTVYVTYGARKNGEYTLTKVNEVSASENVTDVATQSFAISQGVNKVSIKRASGNEGVVTKVVWIPTGSAYEVTENLQNIILEQNVVGDKSYFEADNGEEPKSKSFEGQSRLLYRTKNTNQSVDFTVTGAKAVQIVATGATSKGGTQYTVSINGGAKQTITMSGSTDTSEPIVLPEGISTITIAGTGSGDLYPAKLIFYTITPSAIVVKKNSTTIASDKLFYNEGVQTYNVTSSNTLTPITMTHTVPADVATVSFDASEGTLTITPKSGPEGSGVITFHQDGTQDGTVAEGSKALALDVIWDYYEMKYANDITIDMNTATMNPFDHDIVLKPEAYTDNGVSVPAFPTLNVKKFDKDHKSGTSVTVDDDFLGALTYTTDDITLAKNGIGEDGRGILTVTHGRQGVVYITATFEGDAAQHISKASASYSLTVKDGIMYSVPNATTLNAQQQIKLEDNGNLKLTLTMGGYKYGKIWNGTKPDTWSKSNEYGGGEWVNYVDGYRYQAGGSDNAGCEKVQSTGSVYGVQFYEEGTAKAEGGTYGLYERVHPFSLPVRGAYLTLSPEVNGTATVYVLQNGNLNYDTSVDEEDVLKASDPLSTSPRVYYWADQDGYIIDPMTTTHVTPVAKQPLVNGNNQTRGGNGNGGNATISAEKWNDEWEGVDSKWKDSYEGGVLAKTYLTTTRTLVDGSTGIYFPDQATVNTNLANKGTATEVKPQYVIPYHGGYMVMQKCYVKYVINVLAGKTYYFFSNASKLGFAGVNFKEDTSVTSDGVTTVASSKVESLTLDQSNDNWLEGTSMNAYKGKQIKSVTLNRTFTANTWNTICLPFNVSEKQVQEIFGNVSISDGGISVSNNKATNPVDASKEAELVLYNGFTDSGFNTAYFLRHVDQNILAGQPYFIMPKKEVINPTFKNVLVPQSVAMQTYGGDVGTIEWYKGTEDPFEFTGTLKGGNTLNQYDHYINVNDGKLYYMDKGASLTGFPAYRAYLKSKNNNVYKAKAINAVSFGDFESEDDNAYTTGIMQVLVDEGVEIAPLNGVYNLKGQKVANSTKGLSKGIYIVNGHKVSIK